MPLRKQRVPQGISNKSQKSLFGKLSESTSTNVQLLKPSQSLQAFNRADKQVSMNVHSIPNYQSQFTLLKKNNSGKLNFKQFQQKQSQHNQQISGKKQKFIQKSNSMNLIQKYSKDQFTSNAQKAILKLRGIYKYKTNIKKIVKSWGFQNKPYINEQQFRNVMTKHFQTDLTTAEATQIFRKVTKNSSQNIQPKLDMPSFIALIYNSVPFPNPMIDITQKVDLINQNAPLIKKIKNLNQINLYGEDSEDLKKIKRLPSLNKQPEKSASKSFILNESFNKSSLSEFGEPSLYKTMYNSSNPKYSYSTKKQHAQLFTPIQYLNINQQKTRFNATPATKLNDQTLLENKRQKILDQKLKIVAQLNSDMQFQKQRYQNKLSKIRLHKQKQNMMIQEIDRKKQLILRANMKKTLQENMAYQYINFVKNDWK